MTVRPGQMGARKAFRLPLYAKYLTAIRSVFLCQLCVYAVFLFIRIIIICIFRLRPGKRSGRVNVILEYYSLACRLLCHYNAILRFNQVETNFKSFFHIYVGNILNTLKAPIYTRARMENTHY